jgi:hypothetical protein
MAAEVIDENTKSQEYQYNAPLQVELVGRGLNVVVTGQQNSDTYRLTERSINERAPLHDTG